jgi:hypothetical protein
VAGPAEEEMEVWPGVGAGVVMVEVIYYAVLVRWSTRRFPTTVMHQIGAWSLQRTL